MKTKIILNPDKEHVLLIKTKLKENDGYCPCSILRNDLGFCHCHLYKKVETE